MSSEIQETYQKLCAIRERRDIQLRRSPLMADTYIGLDGEEREFKLRPYQSQMVLHLLAMSRFLVGDDTGTGKTVMVISAICYLWEKDPNLKVLIFCNKSAVGQWVDAFKTFTKVANVVSATGSPKRREAAYEAWETTEDYPVLVVGYGSARRDFRRMQDWSGYALILDEAQVFKNPRAQIHQICRYLADPSRAVRVWGLTATLIKNNLLEGYGIMRVLVPELFRQSLNSFMREFCIVHMQPIGNGRKVPVVRGYRQSDVLKFKSKIDPYHLGRAKFDVAQDLPVLQVKEIKHGLTQFQAEKYGEALDGLLSMGDGEDRETTKLTSIIYCQEIVDHPYLIGFEDAESEKFEVLADLIGPGGDLDGEKVILFTRFRRLVDFAQPWLEKKLKIKSVRVTGSEKSAERNAAMAAFQQHDSGINHIWITLAGSDSINLHAAKAIVFLDTPWSAGDYLQCLGRAIRIGSMHDSVYAIHLVARNTIDVRTLSVVRRKLKLLESVLGKRIRGGDDMGVHDIIDSRSELNELYEGLVHDARSRR